MAHMSDALQYVKSHGQLDDMSVFFTRYLRLRSTGRLFPDRTPKIALHGGTVPPAYDTNAILNAIKTGGKTPVIGNRLLTPAQMTDLVNFEGIIKKHVDIGNFAFFVLDKATKTEVKELLFIDNYEGKTGSAPIGRRYVWDPQSLHFK